MPRAALRGGIELEYETFGSPDDPALLLIMGFTAQLIAWDDALCARLAAGGHYVIRYDNRDCGLSTCLDGAEVDLMAVINAALSQRAAAAGAVHAVGHGRATRWACSTTCASPAPTSWGRPWAG